MGESNLKVFAAPTSREAAAEWLSQVEQALTAQPAPHVIVWGDAAFFADRPLMDETFAAWCGLPRRSLLIVVRVDGARMTPAFSCFEWIDATAKDAARRIAAALSQSVRS